MKKLYIALLLGAISCFAQLRAEWQTSHWKYEPQNSTSGAGWELRSDVRTEDLFVLVERYSSFNGAGIFIRLNLPKGGGCLQYSAVAAADRGETVAKLRRSHWTLTDCKVQPDKIELNYKPNPILLQRVVLMLDEVRSEKKEFWKVAEPYLRELLPLSSK